MKSLTKIGLIAASIFALSSCVKESIAPDEQNGTHTLTFTVQKEAETKTSVVEEGDKAAYYWTEGDENYFHIYENGVEATAVTMTLSSNNKIATFKATFNDSNATGFTYSAVYGSSVSNARNPLISYSQTPCLNSFDPSADVLISTKNIVLDGNAEADENTEFVFTLQRVVTANKMTLKGLSAGETVKSVKLSSTDSFFSSRYKISDGTYITTDGKKWLEFDYTSVENATVASDGTFPVYFISAPVAEASFSVEVITDQKVYLRDNFTSTLTFELGKFRRFGINLEGYGTPISTGVNYELVTSQSGLVSGEEYLIVGGNTYAMGDQKSNNRNAVAVTDNNGVITIDNTIEAYPVIITATTGGYLIQDISNNQYLYAASTSSNYLKSRDDAGTDNKAVWTINISNSVASIVNVGNTDRGIMGFNTNNGSPLFAAYGTIPDTGTANLALYKKHDPRTAVTLSFGTASYELSLGTEDYSAFSGQTASTDPSGISGVTYELTGDAIGTVDENTGDVTLDGETAGTATITASFAGNATYRPAVSVSYTITVIDPSVADCVILPWSYPNEGESAVTMDLEEITGVIANGLGDYSTGNGNEPYLIKMDGTGDYIQVKTNASINTVSIKYKKIGGAGNSTLTISQSQNGNDWTTVQTLTLTGSASSTGTVTTSNSFDPTSRYVKIEFTKASSGNTGIGGISITELDNTPRFTVASPLEATAAADDYTVDITRTNFTGAISVSVPTDCDWISASNVAANANTVNIHVAANTGNARTATLTLSGTDVATQELVVNQAGIEHGTAANPYSVSEALEFIETLGNQTSSDKWVSGIISRVESYSSTYHSIYYYISEDGSAEGELYIYSGKGLNGANFTDITDLAVGDAVVVKGNLKKYNGTSEFTQNSQIVSITPATRYTVTLTSDSNGSLSVPNTQVGAGSTVTITITPNSGYQLDVLTVAGTNVTSSVNDNTYSFEMPSSNVSVNATFAVSQSLTEQLLFHESFGNNSGSARNWNDSYSVKTGIPAVYSEISSYTVTNAKQSKNNVGSELSGLLQSSTSSEAVLIIGPLAVSDCSEMVLSYQWKAASLKGTYNTQLYYATSANGSYTEVTGTGTGATTFVKRSYNLPEAAQVATLYLKIVWSTSNTQAIIDEVDLTGKK